MARQPSVLVLDDNKDVRTILSELLTTHGYEVFEACDGKSALEQVDHNTIDVGIIDLMLPDMNGMEIIEAFKNKGLKLECIVLTAHASQESAVKAVGLGAYSYIEKPFDAEHLLITVRRAYEKHIAEEERATRMAELEQLNNELKITQAELIQSGKLSVIGQMAAEMAHEVNNPLSAIRLHAGALKRKLVSPSFKPSELKESIEAIEKSTRMITEVVTRMRYFSRRSNETYGIIDLNDVISDSLKMLRKNLFKESIELHEKYVPSPLMCFGNTNMLDQLFTNLILNARDAVMVKPSNKRLITIETNLCKDMSAQVTIKDSGQGMDEETKARLFDPFFTTKPDGVGLGLAIAKRIIDVHGGTIEVTSVTGEGTSFLLTFPRDRRSSKR